MRVSGRKLRLAVGTGIAALMLTVGVSSVGATSPSATGGITVIVTGSQASAVDSTNPTVTVTTYRDAVRLSNPTGGGNSDGCVYYEVGNVNDGRNVRSVDVSGCGPQIIQPAAYPLWLVHTGAPGSNVLVVPETDVPGVPTAPAKTYIIDTFR